MLMILSPTEQCGVCLLFVTNLLVNIMLFSMLKSRINSCANHSHISATSQLAAIILRSRMSGFILDILSLQVVTIKLTLLANKIPFVVRSITYCVFPGKRDPITKLSLLRAYCSSLYFSVVWDLSHSSIDAFCAIWRKGLRRIWNLPYATHCALLPLP